MCRFDVFRSSDPPLTLTLEAGPPLGLVDSVLYRVNSSSPAGLVAFAPNECSELVWFAFLDAHAGDVQRGCHCLM